MTDTKPDEKVHHDRKAVTSADTWDEEPMDPETALELMNRLGKRDYEVRLTVEAKHKSSAIVKTIDNDDDAQTTLGNIQLDEEYPE